MRKWAALLLAVLLALTAAACARQEQEGEEGDYLLYGLGDEKTAAGGDAIQAVPVDLDVAEDASATEIAQELMEKLCQGAGEVSSPLPENVSLNSIRIQGRRAYVDFNSRYAALTGIDLSLADYCVTLTLTQLEEISAVSITAGGRELPYRDSQVFMEQDVLFSSMTDVIETVEVQLYFLGEDGSLTAETRKLELYEGQSLAESLILALMEGPKNDKLTALLPENFVINGIWVESRTCYLSLSSRVLEHLPEDKETQELILASIANSIYSMDGVDELRILVDGVESNTFGKVSVTPYTFRPESEEATS